MSVVITTSPQYDLTLLKRNQAIHIKQTTGRMLNVDALIEEVTPINIKCAFFFDNNAKASIIDINISEITTGVTTVSILTNPDIPVTP